MKIILSLFLIFTSDLSAAGLFDGDTSLAKSYYDTGGEYLEKAQYDSVLLYLERAERIFRDNEMWDNAVSCLNRISYSLRQVGKFDSALTVAKGALTFGEEHSISDTVRAQTFDQLGFGYLKQSNFEEAFRFSFKAKDIFDRYTAIPLKSENYSLLGQIHRETSHYDSALIYFNKATQNSIDIYGENHISIRNNYVDAALTLVEKGDYEKALEYNVAALELVLNTFGETHRESAIIFNNIGTNYFYNGDNDLALEYYLKGLSIDLRVLKPDDPELGARYNNISMAYRVKGDLDNALEFALKSKDIWYHSLGDKHPYYGVVINNIGRIYSDKQDYDKALELFTSSYEILKERLGESNPMTAQAQNNIGETYTKKGDYDKGLENLQESLSARLSSLGSTHPKVAATLIEIGKNYYYQNLTDSAISYFQDAVIASTERFDAVDVTVNPDLSLRRYDRELLQALFFKARTLNKQYLSSGNVADLEKSLSTYELCSELVVEMRQSYKSESSKYSIGNIGSDIILEGMSAAKALYDVSADKAYLGTAFELAEKGKAGVLSDALAEANAKTFSGIPDSLLQKERQLRIDLASYDTQIQKEKEKRDGRDSAKVKSLQDLFFALHREYQDMIDHLEKNNHDYYQLKYQTHNYSTEEISNDLNDKSGILEYVVSDSVLYIVAITKGNVALRQVRLDHPLRDDVLSLRNSLHNIDFETYVNTAHKLYSLLIKPIENDLGNIERLSIIPDGILNYLPFELLLIDNKTNGFDFAKLNYLIGKYEIGYYFTASGLHDTRNRQRKANKGFAGFAPVFSDDSRSKSTIATLIDTSITPSSLRSVNVEGRHYSSLPETEHEINEIGRLFDNKNIPARTFLHSLANEETIKSDGMNQYGIVHIASHGFINENKPKLSGILFWIDGVEGNEDGVIYSGEIYNLNLNADLLVLSACETGLGKIIRGEGIIGLTRGFIYSGARNILVSLWQVADKSTSELMIRFYESLLDGNTASSSLRNAKLSLIREGQFAYPLEWAPFVLIGSN